MQNPFEGQERLFEEERKVREVISAPISRNALRYMLDHIAFKIENFPSYLLEYQKNHPAFRDTETKNGKIIYDIQS